MQCSDVRTLSLLHTQTNPATRRFGRHNGDRRIDLQITKRLMVSHNNHREEEDEEAFETEICAISYHKSIRQIIKHFEMVFANCLSIWQNEEFRQFLADYWEEAKKYDPFIAFLAVWGVFTPPVGMDVRKRTRTIILVIQVMISIGLSIQLKCQRDPMAGGVVVIMTMIFSTIPLEIINLLWFRVVMKRSLLLEESQKTDSSCRRCCMWTRQYLGTTLGVLLTLCIFSYSIVFFILAFAGIHPGCDLKAKNLIIRNILLYQFFLTPTFMSLPYWREMSVYLSLLGPAGPVVGTYLYVKKNGFHPPKKEPELEKPAEETKDIEASNSASASEPVKQGA